MDLKRVFGIKVSMVRQVCLAAVSSLSLFVSACGVQVHPLPSEHQTSGSTLSAHTTTATPSRPLGVNRAALPQKQPLPVLHLGMSGTAALELNEALSVLHYLPVQFVPASDGASGSPSILRADLAAHLEYGNTTPLTGTWLWETSYPASLRNLWNPDTVSVMTQGAVMRFEHDNGLPADGTAGPQVDGALALALRNDAATTSPYRYVTVLKGSPEHIEVWENGHEVFSSLANTGIAQSPTPDGTWPIYLRMTSQTMTGTEPSGKKYSDPGVPWVNYFYKGCAIHGFPRASYGSPQSLGCVELPVSAASRAYQLLDYGTLVTVS